MLSACRLNGPLRYISIRKVAENSLNCGDLSGKKIRWDSCHYLLDILSMQTLSPPPPSVKAVGACGVGDQGNKWRRSHLEGGMVARNLSLG